MNDLMRELAPGERLLWSGVPRQGVIVRASDALLIPFSLLWGGFAVFWEYGVVKSHAPLFMALWGVPFLIVGAYMIVGRFFVDARVRAATMYGITDKRVVIVSTFLRRTVRSLPLAMIPEISLTESSDGSGTIILGGPSMYASLPQNSWTSRRVQLPMLEGIPRVRNVYDMILAAQKQA